MRTVHKLLNVAVVVACVATLSACKDSATAPEGRAIIPYAWAATYATAEKFGGAAGKWNARADVQISADRRVFVGETEIMNPLVGETSVSWTMADGNTTNASFQFLVESSSDYFWGDVGVAGKLFQGWIQYPGQGKLDYRGLAR